jgi:DNA-binding NtrC family response regulator
MEDVRLKVLILDDDPLYRRLSSSILKERFDVLTADKPSDAFGILAKNTIDFIICDYRLPEMDGLQVLDLVKKQYPKTEVIMISDSGNMDTVIESLRRGAIDYFRKPFTPADLWMSIEKSRKFVALRNEFEQEKNRNNTLLQMVSREFTSEMIGNSGAMKDIRNQITMLAQTPDTSVLILGESGTGKELVARAIHQLSDRNRNFFGAVNMSAIPEQLFESEFFGHKKGSFTGAVSDKTGWFETADRGTLFLDEIGDMPLNLQVKLLRVLEDRTYTKVGTQKAVPFDIRIVAATNKPLREITASKEFRTDLFHRLGTFIIHLPPLRERKEDIDALVQYFVQQFASKMNKPVHEIKQDVFNSLRTYHFPGNIRELRNIIERAVILSSGGIITANHLMFANHFGQMETTDETETDTFDLTEIEIRTIRKALIYSHYNIAHAARLLNIEWNALYRRMQKYQIEIPK